MSASTMTIDFRNVPEHRQHKSGKIQHRLPAEEPPRTGDGKLLTPKQIRARARRKMARSERLSDQEMEYLYQKPIDEWDNEELARGRPRGKDGRFGGPKPKWINAQVHEEAMERFAGIVKSEMNATTVDALQVLRDIMANEETDDKGKPLVPASTKVDAAKFLIEHVIGKPKQRIESDVSVKLQGILAQVMVNPADALGGVTGQPAPYVVGHLPGITMDMGDADPDAVDAEFEAGGW